MSDERNGRWRVGDAFDQFGDREWERLDLDVASRVSFALHRRWLARHEVRGRVLEIGAGAGRFTVELVRSGCRVVVADISTVQLDLNHQHVAEADALDGIEGWAQADICDLPRAWRSGFDAVVAYGGVLSYVFDDADTAASQCLQALRAGGVFVGSVMSLAGNARLHIDSILELARDGRLGAVDELLRTGDQRAVAATGVGRFQHFTLDRLCAVIESAGGSLREASASNWLTADGSPVVVAAESDDCWDWLLDAEEAICRAPGTIEGGSDMLFAAGR